MKTQLLESIKIKMKTQLLESINIRNNQAIRLNEVLTYFDNLLNKLGDDYKFLYQDNIKDLGRDDNINLRIISPTSNIPFVIIYYFINNDEIKLTFDTEKYFTITSEQQLETKIFNFIKQNFKENK